MLLTLQKYKKLQSSSKIWDILHNYVTNDTKNLGYSPSILDIYTTNKIVGYDV